MLAVTQALPNPAGKDRQPPYPPTQNQLNNEWLQFSNLGQRPITVQGVALFHYTFTRNCQKTGEDLLLSFANTLHPGHSIRVHTGAGTEWLDGAIHHVFAGRENYVWNNTCADTAVLRDAQGILIDWAAYDENPPEGVILNRIPGTNRLAVTVPAFVRK